MRGAKAGVVMILTVIFLVAAGHSAAQEPGQVGGPPTMNLPRKDFGRKTSDVIVIGTGTAFNGPIEILAYRTVQCLVIEVDQTSFGSATESCLGSPLSRRNIVVDAGSFGYGYLTGRRKRIAASFEDEGRVSLQASNVQVVLKRRGGRKFTGAALAKPEAAILARLHQTEPFAYWAAVFRGCRKGKLFFSARAFDPAGLFLGSATFPNRCLGA
jgi:hypothetical protein